MSLNGLDEPAVIDAYQTALKEAGGWLLLKYASRDEVTLLGRGSGGVPDVRSTIEGYEERSPLYGFLQYRRRKVVLKYIPDGMSRLVQARTTVQFQSILDKFSPQDTTFEFKAPADLTESALSSACLLHAVSGSITSSSSSLRRRQLMEIAEDAEEGPPPITAVSQPPESSEDVDGRRLSQASDMTAVPPKAKDDESPSDLPVVEHEADARSETESVRSISRRKFFEQFQQDSFERRTSTQSMRPSLQELRHAAAPYRQKVKPEYHPSMDINGRPRTAGSMSRGQEHRPTAALPAGVRSRKPSGISTNRPKSTPDVPPVPTLASLRNAPPVPLLIPPPTLSIARPKLSPGAKSLNALPSSGMSPEKQRLMKALELRKRQMEKKTQELQKKPAQHQHLAPITEPTMKSSLCEAESFEDSSTQVSTSEPIPTEKPDTVAVEIPAATTDIANGAKTQKPQSADIAKADSAVEMVSLASKSSSQSTTSSESGDIDSKAEILHEEPAAYDSTLPSESYDTQSSQNEVKNITPDITSTNEATESSSEGEAPMTPRTSDSDNTVRLIEVPDTEEEYSKDQESQIIGNSVSIIDQSDEDIAAKTQETHEQPENVQDADREDNTERSELITIVATIDDLESPDIQQTPSAMLDEESAIPLSQPLGHAVEVSAEDTPLPCESGDDLQETVPTEAALESVSTAQEQTPLPQLQEKTEKTENQKPKRLVVFDPIQLPTPDFSDDENLLSDDSFMEELTSATVQEAQPVSVGKGPLSPDGEPRTPLEAWQTRAVSNPSSRPRDSRPTTAESRSFSATFGDGNNNQAARPVPVMVAKKVNVSSGISKRIKALEMFSNNHDSVPSAPGNSSLAGSTATPSSSAFEKFRKRASVFSNGNLPSTTPSSRSSFLSIAEPSSLNRSDSRSIPRMNSVSVTARIVRDSSSSPAEAKTNPLETHLTSLQRSPLIVRHDSSDTQISDNAVVNSATELETNTFSPVSQSTDQIASRSESRASLRSQTEDWRSRNGSTGELGANSDDKKDSRRSRFLRRMSSLRSPSHKSLISPPPGTDKQQFFPAHAEETTQPASREAVDIGEVNVQFPDTLLWKRRFLRIDDQGYLVLTPANMDTAARNIVKRYHLSEFKTPCLPDEERQELPNSILLDFRDGNTLQCACESRKGQAAALQTLVEMHNAYQQ